MAHQIFYGFIFVLFAIYAILGLYIWYGEIVPFWETNKQKFDVKFWTLEVTRELKRKAFLESFSNDADKPWSYYIVKYRYVPGWILLIIFMLYYYIFY